MPMTAGTRVATERRAGPCCTMADRPLASRSQRTESRALEHVGAGRVALALEECGQLGQRVVVLGTRAGTPAGRVGGHVRQALQLHVEVAHGAEHAAQPAELLAEHLGPHGEHVGEQRQRGAAGDGWPPACRGAPRGPRRAVSPAPSRAARPAGGAGRRRRARPSSRTRRPRSGRGRASRGSPGPWPGGPPRTWRGAPAGARTTARSCSTIGLEGIEPLGPHLDLDPAQLRGPLPAADDDHGVVERDLGDVDAADAQGEGTAPGPDLEHLAQPARADDGAQAAADRSVGPERGDAGRAAGPRSPRGAGAGRCPPPGGCPSG